MTDQPVQTTPPGKSCGTCGLCCKVFDFPPPDKPAGQWCPKCAPGRGCTIYDTRPEPCRDFNCLWLTQTWLGAEWKPTQARFVLTIPDPRFLVVQLDPGQPKAWREAPYYARIKRWAIEGQSNGRFVIVMNRTRATVVLPDLERDLGDIGPGDQLGVRERLTPTGLVKELVKIGANLAR